ncbi:MAG: oligosaccharide flippase family protein [Eubacteriales bacterium]
MDNNIKQANARKSDVSLFFSGVLILTVANILVKAVGLVIKIALNRVVESVGAGYYSSAYEIYAYLYVISTAGLPVALSIMVSKSRASGRFNEAKKIFNIAMAVFLTIGFVFSTLMIAFSDGIASFIGSEETSLCIVAIAPTILFICLSSCMRGYFQGYQQMSQTAISQFIEAVCKVGVGVALAVWAKSKGYDDFVVAAYTILGVTVGVFLGMVFLYIRKLFFKEERYNALLDVPANTECKKTKPLLKELFAIAIPITISSSVLSLTTIIDTLMVQNRLLSSGMDPTTVKILYGDYATLVISMFNLPTILLYPMVNALVPLISAARARKDREGEERMRSFSVRFIMLLALPCALGLGVFSSPILDLLMFRQDSVERAAPWLSIAAVSVVFLGIIAVTNAFLNTAGRQKLPIISMVAGASVKLISNYFLIGSIGMYGAPISTVLCYLCAASLNIFFTVKYVGKLPDLKNVFVFPLLSSALAVGGAAGVYLLLSRLILPKIATVIAIVAAVVFYAFFIGRTGSVKQDEIEMLPNGNKISNLLIKLKILPQKK